MPQNKNTARYTHQLRHIIVNIKNVTPFFAHIIGIQYTIIQVHLMRYTHFRIALEE